MDPIKIRHAVEERGTTLAALARSNGLSNSALRYALKYPSRRAEEILAAFLDIAPQALFPARYDKRGNRRVRFQGLGPRGKSARRARAGQ